MGVSGGPYLVQSGDPDARQTRTRMNLAPGEEFPRRSAIQAGEGLRFGRSIRRRHPPREGGPVTHLHGYPSLVARRKLPTSGKTELRLRRVLSFQLTQFQLQLADLLAPEDSPEDAFGIIAGQRSDADFLAQNFHNGSPGHQPVAVNALRPVGISAPHQFVVGAQIEPGMKKLLRKRE